MAKIMMREGFAPAGAGKETDMTELERLEQLRGQAEAAAEELVQKAGLRRGQIVVVGCSTSAISGQLIGSASAPEVGQAVFEGIRMALYSRGIYLAAQCCEHLNRAIITEAKALPEDADIVNVVPQSKFITEHFDAFAGLSDKLQELSYRFLGLDLSQTPSFAFWKWDFSQASAWLPALGLFLIPVLSALLSWLSMKAASRHISPIFSANSLSSSQTAML